MLTEALFNRLSLHIKGDALYQHEQDVLAFCQRYEPSVFLVMDHDDLCIQLVNAHPDMLVIQRRYSDAEGSQWDTRVGGYMTPRNYAMWLTLNGGMDKRIAVQVLNEPHAWGDDITTMCNWLIAVGRELTAMGYRAVLGNIGAAIYAPEVIESGRFDDYLRYLHEESLKPNGHLGGWHDYTFAFLPFGAGVYTVEDLRHPERLQPPWPDIDDMQIQEARETLRAAHFEDPDIRWPYPSDDIDNKPHANWWLSQPGDGDTAQVVYPPWWHLFREQWFRLYAESVGIGWHKYVMTEGVWDDMPDLGPTHIKEELAAAYGIPLNTQNDPYEGLRGPLTLANVWRAWWPQWTPEQAAFEQWAWFHRNLEDACLGMTAFTVSYDEWNYDWGYNLMLWPEFLALLVANKDKPRRDDPPPVDPPIPPDPPPPTLDWWGIPFVIFGILLGIVVLIYLTNNHVRSEGAIRTMEIITVDKAAEILMVAIATIIAGGLSSTVTTPLVNLLKLVDFYRAKLIGGNALSGNLIAALVAVVVTVVVWISRWAGIEVEINNVFDLIAAVLPPVLLFLATALGQKQLFATSVKNNIPVFGYQRTPDA